MDISLNSSAILVIIVGLWLVWVVPFFLRRQEGMPGHHLALARNLPAVTSPSLAEDSSSQGNILENTSKPTSSASPASTPAAAPPAAHGSHSPRPSNEARPGSASGTVRPFKIRYGRTALAGFGALALVTAVITAVISVFGLVPAYLPILSLVAAVASVAALRVLALRDRTKRSEQRVEAAFREAMNPGTGSEHARPGTAGPADESSSAAQRPAKAPEPDGKTAKRETKLFDAENLGNDGSAGQSVPAPAVQAPARTSTASPEGQRLTAQDLRQAALAVAAESDTASTDEAGQTWQPVDVPKPKYVESAKADRPTPEPLELPAEPKPEGKPSIKAGAVAPKADVQLDQEAVERTEKAKPSGGLHDLDNVLQRRRA